MKKSILLIIGYCVTLPVLMSQSEPILKSKKGNYILPQEKDWGIGISATPILNYLGNAFNNTDNNTAPSFTDQSPFVISTMVTGKYMYRSDLAFVISIYSDNTRNTIVSKVPDLSIDAEPDDLVENKRIEHNYTTMLNLGFEKRRGSTRLQGIYGANVGLGYFSGDYTTFKYGNHIEDFAAQGGSNERIIKDKSFPSMIMISTGAHLGIEYFFAPRMSIGGYYAFNIGFNRSLTSEDVYEVWSSSEGSAFEDKRLNSNRVTTWQLGSTWASPNLSLYFYF